MSEIHGPPLKLHMCLKDFYFRRLPKGQAAWARLPGKYFLWFRPPDTSGCCSCGPGVPTTVQATQGLPLALPRGTLHSHKGRTSHRVVRVYMGMCHMCVSALTGQKGAPDALEPKWQVGSRHWGPGQKHGVCISFSLFSSGHFCLFGFVFETGKLSIADKQKVSNS